MAGRRITDASTAPNRSAELRRRGRHYADGDTDLAWTRITGWRAVLAAALDQPPYEPVTELSVAGAFDSPSADLLAAWLVQRLASPITRVPTAEGTGIQQVRLERESGPIELTRGDGDLAILRQPGQPERHVSLPHRTLSECLADELRRLSADETYAATLVQGLPRVYRRASNRSEGS